LRDVADRPAVSVPLGIGRLVEVARALACEPTVMLLDEPSSGLDVHETEQLGEALRNVREERGTAFVLVEHNVEFVLGLSDRITVLDFGKVLLEGTPDDVRRSAEVQAAYFGAPTGQPSNLGERI
jgi:branched-chain amino acid transport system ATP-binding protein